MTRDEAQQRFVALLQERFGVEEIPDDNYPLIDAKHHFELARVLREELAIASIRSSLRATTPKK